MSFYLNLRFPSVEYAGSGMMHYTGNLSGAGPSSSVNVVMSSSKFFTLTYYYYYYYLL